MLCEWKGPAFRNCKFLAQHRHPKAMGHVEQSVIDACESAVTKKFNGQLELKETASTSEPEVDNEEFTKLVKENCKQHRQQASHTEECD